MDRKEWEEKSLDEILENYLPESKIMWEGWPRITKEDLQDYQKPF